MICGHLPGIALRLCLGTGQDNTASESTTSGGSASHGSMETPTKLRLLTTTSRYAVWTEEIMTTEATTNTEKLPPIHPGEILDEEFLRPMNITQYRLAKSIGVDARRIHAIVNGERSISAETALLFSRFFGNSAGFWMGLQSQYDLEVAEERLGERLSAVMGYTV